MDQPYFLMTTCSEKLYIEGKNCDATLLVGDRKFPVHRSILATQSEFFKEMFYDVKCDMFTVVASPVAFECILQYFYSGRMDLNQDIHDFLEMLELARRFGLSKLVENLFEHVVEQINVANLVCIIKNVELIKSDKVVERCLDVVYENSEEFFESQGFLQLNEKEFSSLILNKNLRLGDIKRFEAIADWLIVHLECPRAVKEQLLATVNLTAVANKQLIRTVRPKTVQRIK